MDRYMDRVIEGHTKRDSKKAQIVIEIDIF